MVSGTACVECLSVGNRPTPAATVAAAAGAAGRWLAGTKPAHDRSVCRKLGLGRTCNERFSPVWAEGRCTLSVRSCCDEVRQTELSGPQVLFVERVCVVGGTTCVECLSSGNRLALCAVLNAAWHVRPSRLASGVPLFTCGNAHLCRRGRQSQRRRRLPQRRGRGGCAQQLQGLYMTGGWV